VAAGAGPSCTHRGGEPSVGARLQLGSGAPNEDRMRATPGRWDIDEESRTGGTGAVGGRQGEQAGGWWMTTGPHVADDDQPSGWGKQDGWSGEESMGGRVRSAACRRRQARDGGGGGERAREEAASWSRSKRVAGGAGA
jgi:hypothetical protein